jgi:hypothetical protein
MLGFFFLCLLHGKMLFEVGFLMQFVVVYEWFAGIDSDLMVKSGA